MNIGVHPSPRDGFKPPQPLHIETIAWFDPAIPPQDNRTVIVRIAGLAGTWPAFFEPSLQAWFSTHDGDQVDGVEAWAEQPTGIEPRKPQRTPAAAEIIGRITMTSVGGFALRLTQAGRALPIGEHELQLVPTSTPRSPA